MNKITGFILTLSILVGVLCCQKAGIGTSGNNGGSGSNNNGGGNTDGTAPSEVGTPTGPSVSQLIPASGGSLATADGRMELDIPPGALSAGQTITIQNITNSAKTSTGVAYRFLPDGLTFAVPVTLKFHYDDSDINGSLPELLGIAYQDSSHNWKPIKVTGLDTVAHIISAETNHFTDYTPHASIRLYPVYGDLLALSKLFVNKSETFQAYLESQQNAGEYLPAERNSADMSTWKVNNLSRGNSTVGTIADATAATGGGAGIESQLAATYTAPAHAPQGSQNPVRITVKVTIPNNFLQYLMNNFQSSSTSVSLPYKVKILEANIYKLEIVDWQGIGCNQINYYDSATILFRLGPDNADSYAVGKDSIENFSPFAYPSSTDCSTCHYDWISEPIGTINITSVNVTYSGYPASYFVDLKWNETNGNLPWFDVTCSGVGTTVKHRDPYGDFSAEFPLIIDATKSSLDTLIAGTMDKAHVRLTLVKFGIN